MKRNTSSTRSGGDGRRLREPRGLFDDYRTNPVCYDEMFDADDLPREHCRELWAALKGIPRDDIAQMQKRAERSFLHEGITFSVYGEASAQERIIPIDIIPRLVSAEDWDFLERGLRNDSRRLTTSSPTSTVKAGHLPMASYRSIWSVVAHSTGPKCVV